MELRTSNGRALIDGRPFDVPDGDDPAAALVAYAQEHARTHGGLLAHIVDDSGTDVWVYINPAGELTPAPAPPHEGTQGLRKPFGGAILASGGQDDPAARVESASQERVTGSAGTTPFPGVRMPRFISTPESDQPASTTRPATPGRTESPTLDSVSRPENSPIPEGEGEVRPGGATLSQWSIPPTQASSSRFSRPVRDPHDHDAGQRGGRGVDRRLLLGGLAGAGLLALAGGVWAFSSDHGSPTTIPPTPASTPTHGEVPDFPPGQYAPDGWSQHADWAIENIASLGSGIAVRDDLLVVVTSTPGSGVLTVHGKDADTGSDRWHLDLNRGEQVNAGPYLVRRDRLYVLVMTDTRLVIVDAASGKQVSQSPIPSSSASSGCSLLGPWIPTDAHTVLGLTGSTSLKPFTLPAGAAAYGTYRDQMIAATGHGQVWKLEAGQKPGAPIKLDGPKGANPGVVVGVTEKLLITSWGQDRDIWVVGYDLASLKPVWTTEPHAAWGAYVGSTRISPDQTWATVGNYRVDLTNGKSSPLAVTWHPEAVSDQMAWGDDGTYTMTSNRDGVLVSGRATRGGNAVMPVLGGVKERVFVLGSIASDNTLYAVSRA